MIFGVSMAGFIYIADDLALYILYILPSPFLQGLSIGTNNEFPNENQSDCKRCEPYKNMWHLTWQNLGLKKSVIRDQSCIPM